MRIITILILTLLISCKEEVKEKNNISDNKKHLVHNELLNADFYLPNDYKINTIDDFEKELSASRSNIELTKINFGNIEMLKSLSELTTLYTEKNKAENYIFFQKGEYINLNKNIATQYSTMLNNVVEKNWTNFGIDFKLLENKYLQKNQNKIVKIKYLQEFNKVKKYLTQYLITAKGKTFSVMVCNFENVDFEEEFKKIKLK